MQGILNIPVQNQFLGNFWIFFRNRFILFIFHFCNLATTKLSSVRYIPVIRHASTAVDNFRTILRNQLNDVHVAGTYKNERIISSPQKTVINIEGSSKSVINFCANNYLGMSVSVWEKKTHQIFQCIFSTKNYS